MKVVHRTSPFIRQFDGPGANNIVCFRFWQAVVASGCPGECAYCFLQTQRPYRNGSYELKGTLFRNLDRLADEAERWIRRERPAGLIVGENQDGLAFERPYKKLLGITPLELLIPIFADPAQNRAGCTLIVLSKFTSTEFAERFGPTQNTVLSWSLSLPSISERYERKVSPLAVRLRKAGEMKQRGYRIRFRLDALAPVPKWEEELASTIAEVNAIKPEMLTVGALRASNRGTLRGQAAANGRDARIFDYIEAKDPSGFKYRTDSGFHAAIFRRIKAALDPAISLGLCKEDRSLWRAIGLGWQGCHCLHGTDDDVAVERMRFRRLPNSNALTIPIVREA